MPEEASPTQLPAPPRMPTAPHEWDLGRLRRGRAVRRAFAIGLAVFLALGVLNAYGVRTREASATGAGYEMSVRYATVSRPGLATPWSVKVSRRSGFPEGITLAVTSAYFDGFDENGLDPSPQEETADGERSVWRFGPSSGETLSVSFDGRIEPGVQLTRLKGSVSVLAAPGGPPALTVHFSTVVLP